MNAMLTRTGQDHLNILWEPFATSTPLKIVPKNTRIDNLLQKQPTSSEEVIRKPPKRLSISNVLRSNLNESKHLVSKKVKKSRSNAYFDLSSSSSDDDEDSNGNKKRPIIKINSKKKTKSFLNNENLETEQTETVNNTITDVNKCKKGDKAKKPKSVENSDKNTVPLAVDLKVKNLKTRNGKGKMKRGISNENIKNVSLSSDEECKIFDDINSGKNLVSATNAGLQTKENIINSKNSHETSKKKDDLNDVNKTEKSQMPKVLLKSKQKDGTAHRKSSKSISNCNKTSKVLKRKCISVTNAEPLKKFSSAKGSDELVAETVNVANAVSPLHIWENKNLSHQLFSDSREQEFINTLDLTSEEINEAVGSFRCSFWQKHKNTPTKQVTSTSQNNNVPKNEDVKQERPIRRKQKPKEFWIPENTTPTNSVNGRKNTQTQSEKNITKSKSKISKQLCVKTQQKDVPVEEIKENNQESNKVAENAGRSPNMGKKVRRKKGIVLKEKKLNGPDCTGITNGGEDKNTEHEFKCLRLDAESDKVVKDSNMEGKAVTADKTVFRLLNELIFKENEMGCSVVQCQSINSFKCGVLKLKAKSEFKCKTLYNNSHLGGVVIKGIIKMKIGEKEMELKEGDMAFVPPLTEWQATNVADLESVFYYWCGRFR